MRTFKFYQCHLILHIYLFFTAPGSYDVEKADKKIHESSPAFSLGVKYKEPKPEDIPGNTCTFSIIVSYYINAQFLITE